MIILQELKEMPVAGTPRSVTRDLIGGARPGRAPVLAMNSPLGPANDGASGCLPGE